MTDKQKKSRGFTLVELVTVLVIAGVLAVIAVPATGRFMENLSFRKETQRIMAALRYARLVSVSRAREVRVKVDEEDNTVLHISGAVEEKMEFGLSEDDHLSIEPEEIIFYPEGVATPAILSFHKGDRVKEITLELLTGLPSIN